MKKSEKGIKAFRIPQETWYYGRLPEKPCIVIGIYHKEGSTDGEFKIVWDDIGIQLRAYNDSWGVLKQMPELIELMEGVGMLEEGPTVREFAELLKKIGFTDLTERSRKEEERNLRSKALLLLDMPENCTECPLECGIADEKKGLILNANICRGCGERNFQSDKKPDWCPLVTLPEKKKEYRKMRCENGVHLKTIGFNKGFNACIEEIIKEREKKWGN